MPHDTPDVINSVVDELQTVWMSALRLQSYRDAWRHLVEALQDYPGSAWMLWDLYRHAMLAGCRRLVDDRSDTVSAVRALRRLAKIAPTVTVDVLLVTRTGDASDRPAQWRHGEATRVLHEVNGTARHDHLIRRAVQADIDRLMNDHDHIIQLANEITTHEAARGTTVSVSQGDIDSMLDHVVQTCQKWVGVLEGAQLSGTPPDVPDMRAIVRALELFDWGAYQRAREERDLRLGPGAVGMRQGSDEQDVEVRYVWPGDSPDDDSS